VVALVAHQYLGSNYFPKDAEDLVFIEMVRSLFPALIAGVLMSAILAASMSTADSQLLASSSAFATDFYKPVIRREAKGKEMMIVGRGVVALISVIALLIAVNPECQGIMKLVGCAWGAFGSAFGPAILLALYWRRFTYKGAIAGIIGGFAMDAFWYCCLSGSVEKLCIFDTGIYEIIPGFVFSLLIAVIVSLIDRKP
jgi:sodium/proline symporter